MLELALSNLIANAIKYVNTDGKIEIILDEVDRKLLIEICDNGIGIPKEDINQIFDQFYRASNIDKIKHEGSGMGLALVKEIIERLGGEIIVKSPSHLATENNPGTSVEILINYKFKAPEYDILEVNDQDYLTSKSNS